MGALMYNNSNMGGFMYNTSNMGGLMYKNTNIEGHMYNNSNSTGTQQEKDADQELFIIHLMFGVIYIILGILLLWYCESKVRVFGKVMESVRGALSCINRSKGQCNLWFSKCISIKQL